MKNIVITGGGGYLAGLLLDHLHACDGYDVTLIGRTPRDDRSMLCADIGVYDPAWTDALAGAHAVIHLAASRGGDAPWADLQHTNVEGTLNVFEAAVRNGVRRVIFASSSRVLDGYMRRGHAPLTPELPPEPSSFYAATKAMGESIGRHYAARHGLSVVCLRIGTCHREDISVNACGPLIRQQKWLSARDFCHGMERAIEAEPVGFALLHLTSRIEDSPWSIEATCDLLGYAPRDGGRPAASALSTRLRRGLERWIARRGRRGNG
ncbi:MAG: SDR family oxidoreductase [Thiohalocapsa sp.]|nr:SDR family oxidoreductase [Thiohalocapsa sp.]